MSFIVIFINRLFNPMIKLKDILKESKIVEDINTDVHHEPQVKFSMPQSAHVQNVSKPTRPDAPFVSKDQNISKKASEISDNRLIDSAANVISKFENNPNYKKGGFDKSSGKWFPHKSLEGGSDTIAYGHKILPGEDFSKGMSESEAQELLKKDITKKLNDARRLIKNFDSLSPQVKIAALNGLFRGDLGPKTIEWLNQRNFKQAAKEYLNHKEYKTTSNLGVKKRMDWNYNVLKNAN